MFVMLIHSEKGCKEKNILIMLKQCLYGAERGAEFALNFLECGVERAPKIQKRERFSYTAPAFFGARSGARSHTPEHGAVQTLCSNGHFRV